MHARLEVGRDVRAPPKSSGNVSGLPEPRIGRVLDGPGDIEGVTGLDHLGASGVDLVGRLHSGERHTTESG
eukprot:13762524-Alexandrium_andersonii.AAC.1